MKWMREVRAPSVWRESVQDSPYTSGGVYSVYRCAYTFGPECRCACVVMDNNECGRLNKYFFALSLRKPPVTVLSDCPQ